LAFATCVLPLFVPSGKTRIGYRFFFFCCFYL
jgi:hypothetical protein